ncbi:MAG: nucleotide exchange factor GrpE [Oscillospiraceae bacterium]|nr:nucleotide exchange factor GrpE [Oscillospiraceae bacterium]MDD7537515.1 nucleotide exchange factor GrpE [Oscillospiraceae bacterium]MDY5735225.1 nucleotide exchange factor GrpE [Oscillospiraceae bacterium]
MAKKEEKKPQQPAPEENKAEEKKKEETKAEAKQEAAQETFTLTKEQMEKMEGLAKALADEQDKYLRLAAEYDNYRKRTAKEKEAIYTDAKIDTIKSMLGVYDNLERGIAQYADEESPHRKGLEMVFKQFKECLAKLDVKQMEAVGKPFDPEKHSAVVHVEDERYGENEVVEVLQQGFTLGEKVLRFAIVKVAN